MARLITVELISDDITKYINSIEEIKDILFYDGMHKDSIEPMKELYDSIIEYSKTHDEFEEVFCANLEYLNYLGPNFDTRYLVKIIKKS